MDCSMPGFPVHQQLPELAQTLFHWVGDAIQSSYPLSSPSPPAFSLSQPQGLFQRVCSLHQVNKVLELQHQSFQWIFRTEKLGEKWKQWETLFWGAPKYRRWWLQAMKLKDTLPLGRKAMTNLDSILKSRDITLTTKVCIIKAMVFLVVMYGCESWTIKKAECWRTDAFFSGIPAHSSRWYGHLN